MICMVRALAHMLNLVCDLYDTYGTALGHIFYLAWDPYDLYDTALAQQHQVRRIYILVDSR